MKKYFLTALLGAFCLFGFVSADTVWNFTSSSTIHSCDFSTEEDFVSDGPIMSACGLNDSDTYYMCISTDNVPYTVSSYWVDTENTYSISDNVSCIFTYKFYDATFDFNKAVSGKMYFSLSPITYSSSSGWSSSWSSSWILNSTWQAYLGNVISWISSIVSEFIPYMIYIALAVLVATLWFVAVKWLMNYTSRKVTGLFSSRRKK